MFNLTKQDECSKIFITALLLFVLVDLAPSCKSCILKLESFDAPVLSSTDLCMNKLSYPLPVKTSPVSILEPERWTGKPTILKYGLPTFLKFILSKTVVQFASSRQIVSASCCICLLPVVMHLLTSSNITKCISSNLRIFS